MAGGMNTCYMPVPVLTLSMKATGWGRFSSLPGRDRNPETGAGCNSSRRKPSARSLAHTTDTLWCCFSLFCLPAFGSRLNCSVSIHVSIILMHTLVIRSVCHNKNNIKKKTGLTHA